jgi:hypothetical protein
LATAEDVIGLCLNARDAFASLLRLAPRLPVAGSLAELVAGR